VEYRDRSKATGGLIGSTAVQYGFDRLCAGRSKPLAGQFVTDREKSAENEG
jgi:hypothetical protein